MQHAVERLVELVQFSWVFVFREVYHLIDIRHHIIHLDVLRILKGEIFVAGIKLTVKTIGRGVEAADAYEGVVGGVLDMTCQLGCVK